MNYLISALCPSRGRHALLEHSIKSLRDMAADPSRIEVCVAADPDDIPGEVEGIDLLYVVPHRYGYRESNRYFNELAERASGSWHLLWNDDAEMMTPEWDSVVANSPGTCVLWPYCSADAGMNTFPIWPASWPRLLGHVSLAVSNDQWMTDLGVITKRIRHVPIVISHRRVQDQLMSERFAAELMDGHPNEAFYGEAMKLSREGDAKIISEAFQDDPNAELVSVLLPGDQIQSIQQLHDDAARPSEIEFLVAAGGQHSAIRQSLEAQNLMGLTEVHGTDDFHNLHRNAKGGPVVAFGSFTLEPGWDEKVRRADECVYL